MKTLRKLSALFMVFAMTLSVIAVPGNVNAAAKKVKLNKTKVTITDGNINLLVQFLQQLFQ